MTTPADVVDFEVRGIVDRAITQARVIAENAEMVARRLEQSSDPTHHVKQVAVGALDLLADMATIRAKYDAIQAMKKATK